MKLGLLSCKRVSNTYDVKAKAVSPSHCCPFVHLKQLAAACWTHGEETLFLRGLLILQIFYSILGHGNLTYTWKTKICFVATPSDSLRSFAKPFSFITNAEVSKERPKQSSSTGMKRCPR